MITYFELIDQENRGIIVKYNGSKGYTYDKNHKKWVRDGIMMDYFMADVYDESPKSSDDYREISEDEALEKLGLN